MLVDGRVEFVIIGGVAVIAQGYPRLTLDLDIAYARTPDNLARIVQTLAPLKPRLRGAPPELPFIFDERTLLIFSNARKPPPAVRRTWSTSRRFA